ncbi:hypothetical protein BZA77DRAFT_386396 [Pyronema omphalodes]|nr:hypothetical protein BZA77DRAFT_386396 [Pyronema omphalodes]
MTSPTNTRYGSTPPFSAPRPVPGAFTSGSAGRNAPSGSPSYGTSPFSSQPYSTSGNSPRNAPFSTSPLPVGNFSRASTLPASNSPLGTGGFPPSNSPRNPPFSTSPAHSPSYPPPSPHNPSLHNYPSHSSLRSSQQIHPQYSQQSYPPPSPPPPPFQPLFTLITPTSSDLPHPHPNVHYIFADDVDPTLDLPPANPQERVITVDLDFDTNGRPYVREAHSLSSDYQLVGAEIKEAPQMAWTGGDGASMLVIDGVEGGLQGVKATMGVEELGRVFRERMEMLRRVVEFSKGAEKREMRLEDQGSGDQRRG